MKIQGEPSKLIAFKLRIKNIEIWNSKNEKMRYSEHILGQGLSEVIPHWPVSQVLTSPHAAEGEGDCRSNLLEATGRTLGSGSDSALNPYS